MSPHSPNAGLTLKYPPSGSGVVGKAAPRYPERVTITLQAPLGSYTQEYSSKTGAQIAADVVGLFKTTPVLSSTFRVTLNNPYASWSNGRYTVTVRAL